MVKEYRFTLEGKYFKEILSKIINKEKDINNFKIMIFFKVYFPMENQMELEYINGFLVKNIKEIGVME